MINLSFKINRYIILINSMIFYINRVVLKNENKKNEYEDEYDKFIIKYVKKIIKEIDLLCWWDNIENIKYEFYKMKYIIEKNIDIISLNDIEKVFKQNINNGSKIFKIMKFMIVQPEMDIIIKETDIYKNKLKYEWDKNLKILTSYTEDILGYKENINGILYVVSNRFYVGQADLESKNPKIIYGSKFTNGNYIRDIIYIYHEILHNPILLYEKFDSDRRKIHNVIKLISDHHLNTILNNGTYFENQENVRELLKIYPYWLVFLYRNDKEKVEKIKFSIDRELNYLSKKGYEILELKEYFKTVTEENETVENNIIDFIRNMYENIRI